MSSTQTFASDLISLARTQAQVAFQIGARAIIMAGDSRNEPGWQSKLRESCPELRQFQSNELMLMIQASEVYGPEEKALDLPWSMYVYALYNTDNPREWIQTAARNNWTPAQLHQARLIARPDTLGKDDQTLTAIHEDTITGPQGRLVGTLYVYDDLTQPGARLQANIDIPKGPLSYEELLALRNALDTCLSEVDKYTSVVRNMECPLETPTNCDA